MPKRSFLFSIFPDERLIVARFQGAIREEDVIEASHAVCGDERYRHGFDGLIDLTEVVNEVKPEQIQRLVEYSLSKRKHGHGKWAVIVSTPAATAYAILYQQKVAAKHPFAIFCGFEGASNFLERILDPDWLGRHLPRH